MTFPEQPAVDAAAFAAAYGERLGAALAGVDGARIAAALDLIDGVHGRDGTLFACGNGGSAAIANHLVCDHTKGAATDTGLRPRVVSLSSNIETITALANDVSYDEVFAGQLRCLARPGDGLVTISSSGDSENVVRAAQWAKQNNLPVLSFTGFDGGRSAKIADVNLHVAADNYGIIEDSHQALMHILAQSLRMAHMDPGLVSKRKF